ncbi:MAG: extracellular solute-binding protein [Oscillospiraceae bacterium]|jgi:iron(III) transport system substrate-binding protein
MKKLLSILLTAVLVLGLTACGGGGNQSSPSAEPAQSAAPSEPAASETAEPAAEEQTNSLVLYTSASASEYELIVNLFTEKYPEINVEVVSAGTGELASRINAEKSAPYGDVLMGGGATTYMGIADLLESYVTPNTPELFEDFLSPEGLYTPCYINVNSIIVNKTLIDELGVTVDGWESLTDERLKGNISFASPADSSSALEVLINMLAAMSPTDNTNDGWEFAEKYLANLDGKLASGSSAAYQNVVEGEYAVGLCNEDKTISYMKAGADVYAVYAKEGITLRTSNIGIIKGGANLYNAKLFVDFVTSQECQTAMEAELNVRPARKDVPMTTEGRVATADLVSIPYPQDVTASDVKTQFQDVWTTLS